MKLSEIFNLERTPLDEEIADDRDRRTYFLLQLLPFVFLAVFIIFVPRDIRNDSVLSLLPAFWIYFLAIKRIYVRACMNTLRAEFDGKLLCMRVREEEAELHNIRTAEQEFSADSAPQAEGELHENQ